MARFCGPSFILMNGLGVIIVEPDICIDTNSDGDFVEVFIDYFHECVAFACKNKVPQILITMPWAPWHSKPPAKTANPGTQ